MPDYGEPSFDEMSIDELRGYLFRLQEELPHFAEDVAHLIAQPPEEAERERLLREQIHAVQEAINRRRALAEAVADSDADIAPPPAEDEGVLEAEAEGEPLDGQQMEPEQPSDAVADPGSGGRVAADDPVLADLLAEEKRLREELLGSLGDGTSQQAEKWDPMRDRLRWVRERIAALRAGGPVDAGTPGAIQSDEVFLLPHLRDSTSLTPEQELAEGRKLVDEFVAGTTSDRPPPAGDEVVREAEAEGEPLDGQQMETDTEPEVVDAPAGDDVDGQMLEPAAEQFEDTKVEQPVLGHDEVFERREARDDQVAGGSRRGLLVGGASLLVVAAIAVPLAVTTPWDGGSNEQAAEPASTTEGPSGLVAANDAPVHFTYELPRMSDVRSCGGQSTRARGTWVFTLRGEDAAALEGERAVLVGKGPGLEGGYASVVSGGRVELSRELPCAPPGTNFQVDLIIVAGREAVSDGVR